MKHRLWYLLLVFATGIFLPQAQANIRAQVSEQADTLHFEFFNVKQWDYQIDKKLIGKESVLEITVPAIDPKQLKQIVEFKSSSITKIEVDPKAADGKQILRVFLKDAKDEAFDYLTDQPPRLIVDVFNSEKEKQQKVASTPIQSKKPVSKPAPKKNTEVVVRQPASDALVIGKQDLQSAIASHKDVGIFDGADPEYLRFQVPDYQVKEESLIRSRENIYIEFPMLKIETQELQKFQAKRPIYDIIPKETEENKQARLLQTLFEKKRYHIFLKTAEWFFAKYPESEYDEIIRFMLADSLFSIWLDSREVKYFDLAMLRYRQALEKYPATPLAERTLLLMGFASLDRGDYLGTLRQFQLHLYNRPQSANRDMAHTAIAEAFLRLGRFDDAIQAYDKLETQADSEQSRLVAAFSKPDVYYRQWDFDKAIELYEAALSKYGSKTQAYPNLLYNLAAARFWKGKYKESLDAYVSYLKNFPKHPYGGYAMTRIGELLEILGADKSKAMGAYLEAQFRFGESPSSLVAKLRLMGHRMTDMKPKEAEKAIVDLTAAAEKSDLPKIQQFLTITVSDGHASRKEYDKAIESLVDFYQKYSTTADTGLLRGRIVRNINDKLIAQVDQGNFIEAFKTHNHYAETWLKNTHRIDTKFYLGRAFEQAGVPAQADLIYRDTLNNMLAMRGTPQEKERAVLEKLPKIEQLYLRMAQVTSQQGKLGLSYDYLKEIKNPETLPEKEQIERVQLASLLFEKKGELISAVRYLTDLIQTWKGIPVLVSEPYYQLANLELKMNKPQEALKSYQRIDELMTDSGKVNETTHAKALENIGNIYFDQGKRSEAQAAYQRLLDLYEQKRPLSAIRYRLGKMHFEKGEIQKASEVWKDLEKAKNPFWHKMAQEKLTNLEWQDDYKKYIQRIPAMVKKE